MESIWNISNHLDNRNIDLATYHWAIYNVALISMWNSGIETLLPLITHLTERLELILPVHLGKSTNSLAWFTQDMKRLECAMEDIELASLYHVPHQEESEKIVVAFNRLRDGVIYHKVALERSRYAL